MEFKSRSKLKRGVRYYKDSRLRWLTEVVTLYVVFRERTKKDYKTEIYELIGIFSKITLTDFACLRGVTPGMKSWYSRQREKRVTKNSHHPKPLYLNNFPPFLPLFGQKSSRILSTNQETNFTRRCLGRLSRSLRHLHYTI